jgi:hypothetical protein
MSDSDLRLADHMLLLFRRQHFVTRAGSVVQTIANFQGNNFLCEAWAMPTADALIEPRSAL